MKSIIKTCQTVIFAFTVVSALIYGLCQAAQQEACNDYKANGATAAYKKT